MTDYFPRQLANFRRAVRTALVVVSLAGCAVPPRPIPTSVDPANPELDEAPRQLSLTPLGAPAEEPDLPPPPRPLTETAPSGDSGKSEPKSPAGKVPQHQHEQSPTPAPKVKEKEKAPPATIYACPMHPEVQSATPDRCPKCGMKLVPQEGGAK